MFYNLLKNTYKTQIRNAIAHSQYFLIERRIGLTNYSADPKAYSNLGSISFEDWAVYFYNTILLQNELIKNFNKFRDLYYGETLKYGSLDVRISKRDKTEFFYKVGFRNKDKKDWAWLVNIK